MVKKLYHEGSHLNPMVEKIGQLHFSGNITPHTWFLSPKLQNDKGKPNLVAITLLADIIYWYRPTLIRDEHTGAVIGTKQKFDKDKLQKRYETWGKTFGLSKRQVEDAMAFLKAKGLVTVETRAVETDRGVIPHCAFIEPVFQAIFEITFPSSEETGEVKRASARAHVPKKRDASPEKTGDMPLENGTSLPKKRERTYITTETPKENTAKNLPLPQTPSPSKGKEEEEDSSSASEVKPEVDLKNENISDEQQQRVNDMLEKIAKITKTTIELEKLRPLALDCVLKEHKDAWLHTLSVMTTKMKKPEADRPTMPNRFAATVLESALKSPVPTKAKPQAAPAQPVEPPAPPVDTPAERALRQARKELSGSGAAAFKAKHGRPSSEEDWAARAREIEAAAENSDAA